MITSNKFIRASYGKGLRKYLSEQVNIHEMVDFGELPVFQEAATFPFILLATKNRGNQAVRFTQVRTWGKGDPVYTLVQKIGEYLPPSAVVDCNWKLTGWQAATLLEKLSSNHRTLAEYASNRFYAGIKTGYNAAFIIDAQTREGLIREDSNSTEIIKPFVMGTEVRKWCRLTASRYIIFTHRAIDIEKYPAIKRHLLQFKDRLEKRATSHLHNWFELQQPQTGIYSYYEKTKIVYPDIAKESRFTLDSSGSYIDMTAFVIPLNDLYLLGILNSRLVWYFLGQTASVLGDAAKGGRLRLKSQYIKQIPIPNHSNKEREVVESLVANALSMKQQNPRSDVTAVERQIDQLVYQLYGLTPAEIALVEGSA